MISYVTKECWISSWCLNQAPKMSTRTSRSRLVLGAQSSDSTRTSSSPLELQQPTF